MRGAIAVLSTLCKRFVAILRRCDVESFINIGRLFQEIAPLEKRIDMHIDLLRRDEFREMECTSDINKYAQPRSVVELPFTLAVTGSRHNSTTWRKHISKPSISTWANVNLALCCRWTMIWTYMRLQWV